MSNAAIQNLVMFGSMFAIIYLMILRPQQREKKKHEEAVLAIKKGDELVTAGGLVGEVVHVKTMGTDGAATLTDRITIRSGEARVVIERGSDRARRSGRCSCHTQRQDRRLRRGRLTSRTLTRECARHSCARLADPAAGDRPRHRRHR